MPCLRLVLTASSAGFYYELNLFTTRRESLQQISISAFAIDEGLKARRLSIARTANCDGLAA